MAPTSTTRYARAFATDAETERALRAGLAGREATVQRARLKPALRTLAAEPSAAVVLVDLDGVEEPARAARELAAVCALGTVLIAVGSTDTAQLSRALLGEGIADYLVKPLTATAVQDACAAALDEASDRIHAGRLLAFAGSAGCGSSTLVATLAREFTSGGRTALVVDLDPIAGSLSGRLATEPAGDLPGLLAEIALTEPDGADDGARVDASVTPEQLDSVCAPAGPGLALVAYPGHGALPDAPSPPAVATLLQHLANRAHAVLVTGAHDPDLRAETLNRADSRVVLYEATLTSISTAVQCLALLGPEHPATLVQCHPRASRSTLSPAQVRFAFAERRPDVVIPFEPALHAAAAGRKRSRSTRKEYRKAILRIAERVLGEAPPG